MRYMGAWLGFAWSLANPLLTTLTYFVVFTYIMPTGQPRFALYIVAGVVHWGLLTQLVGRSGDWFIDNGALLRKMRFPHLLMPLANYLAGLSFWLVALVIFFALYPAARAARGTRRCCCIRSISLAFLAFDRRPVPRRGGRAGVLPRLEAPRRRRARRPVLDDADRLSDRSRFRSRSAQ